MKQECKICDGAKHRYDKDQAQWVPCECLRAKRSKDRYRDAGIPERHHTETWKGFMQGHRVSAPKRLAEIAKRLSRGEQPAKWLLFNSRSNRVREEFSSLILKSACDGELTALGLDVPSMIDAQFTEGRGESLWRIECLVIQVGNEPPNKWNRHVLEKAFQRRWARGLFTVLVTNLDPSRIGTTYKSRQIEEAIGENFVRIKVTV